jgi:hypothetical protein
VTSAAAPRPSRAAGCLLWSLVGFVVIVVGGLIFVSNLSFGGEMPELRRPMAVLRGDLSLDRSEPEAGFEADLRLDQGAVDAMHLGDGLVHLELDLESESSVRFMLVGVRWTNRAEVVRAMEPLPLEQDVRWTYACEAVADCARTIGVEIELPDGSVAAEVSWRLVAKVRPPREANVAEVTTVELMPVGGSE